MAPVSLANIHHALNWENTCERNGCNAPLISYYSGVSKCLLARECDIALELHCSPMDMLFTDRWL